MTTSAPTRNSTTSRDPTDQLYAVARQYGIEKRYDHLNPGQQRMTIGIMLRKAVPEADYADA